MTLSPRSQLSVIVSVHAASLVIHSVSHEVLRVTLDLFQAAFVGIFIIAGPLFGLGLMFTRYRALGARVMLVTMAASLVFGLVSHVVLPGPDNAFDDRTRFFIRPGQTPADLESIRGSLAPWAAAFLVTGIALSVLEAWGAWASFKLVRPASQTS